MGTILVLVTYVTPMATLPVTADDLGAGPGANPWILNSMSIGLAASLLAAGVLGDRIGRRKVYLWGLSLVILGAALCASSWNPWLFVGARVLQGAGGGAVLACGLAILAAVYPPGPPRVHATSVWGACLGAGVAGGSVLAVALDIGTQWRENYVAVVVVGLIVLIPTTRTIPESRADAPRKLDVTGLLLLVAAMTLLLVALTQARTGFGPAMAAVAALALAALVAFGAVERRVRHPLINPSLLRHPLFLATIVGALAVGMGMIGMASYLPTVAQEGFGSTLRVASLPPLAWAVASMLSALAVKRLPFTMDGSRSIAVLLVLTAAGMATAIGADSTWRLLIPMTLAGITTGLLNANLARGAVASVPADQAAMASGANSTARYLGAALGITLFAVIASHTGADITQGWDNAVLTAGALMVLGAAAILVGSWRAASRAGTDAP